MKYFNKLPTINYTFESTSNTAVLKNIFYHYELNITGSDYFQLYNIVGVKRLDNISYELYRTTDYWWILAMINDIKDIIFDLPIETEIIHKMARDVAKEIPANVDILGDLNSTGLAYYLALAEEYEEENDAKRVIKVIKPSAITEVIYQIHKK